MPNRRKGKGDTKPLFEHLMDAACEGKVAMMDNLLRRGADPTRTDSDGWNTLFWSLGVQTGIGAETHERIQTIETAASALVQKDETQIDAKDYLDGRTVLHWAAAQNFPRTVKHLIGQNARIDIVDKHGDTPLCLALALKDNNNIWVDTSKAVRVLLDSGADCQTSSAAKGWGPIHWAVLRGQHDIVLELCKRATGAEIRQVARQEPAGFADSLKSVLLKFDPTNAAATSAQGKREAGHAKRVQACMKCVEEANARNTPRGSPAKASPGKASPARGSGRGSPLHRGPPVRASPVRGSPARRNFRVKEEEEEEEGEEEEEEEEEEDEFEEEEEIEDEGYGEGDDELEDEADEFEEEEEMEGLEEDEEEEEVPRAGRTRTQVPVKREARGVGKGGSRRQGGYFPRRSPNIAKGQRMVARKGAGSAVPQRRAAQAAKRSIEKSRLRIR